MFKNKRTNQAGFSLVELMVVVAIIGILAAVAIPNFQRFQRKARQSEARNLLGSIHSAEAAFHGQWENYTTDLVTAGFAPNGTLRYLAGFGVTVQWSGARPSDYTAPADPIATQNSTAVAVVCQPPQCNPGHAWNRAVALPATALGGGAGQAATFTAGAAGDIGGVAIDAWTIDQGKRVLNTVDGVL